MATTTYFDPTAGWKSWALQARTDDGGTPVDDADGEDGRILLEAFTTGVVKPAAGFQVLEDSPQGMTVVVGSGSAGSDVAIIQGINSGQGKYAVRLDDATTDVTISAADASNARIDEIYLVVQDTAYDSSGNVLPRIGYRQGDASASPTAPGPDPSWDAYLLIASIDVGAGVTEIVQANITDNRTRAQVTDGMVIVPQFETTSNSSHTLATTQSSWANVMSNVITIPDDWNSWRIWAITSMSYFGQGMRLDIRISIDGTAVGLLDQLATDTDTRAVTTFGTKVGTSTGNKTIQLEAQHSGTGGTNVEFESVYLHARATRLS